MRDDLGNRMKSFEAIEAGRRLSANVPTIARLDGRAFHTLCKHLVKPYDERLHNAMKATAAYLVGESGATVGYTQSDEISLLWPGAPVIFDGRLCKLTSTLAAEASVFFNRQLQKELPFLAGYMPTFDCRVWQVPSREEAVNTFVWRELDATRNSISALAQSVFSSAELHGKKSNEMLIMLTIKGIDWLAFSMWARGGSWFKRKKVVRPFTVEEIDRLPEKHAARSNPALMVERTNIEAVEVGLLRSLDASKRIELLFGD